MDSILSCKFILLVLSLLSIVLGIVANATVDNRNSKISIGPELEKELRLTKAEKNALDKLKLAMPKDPTMPYLDMELFQIRWLRANSLDVDKTLQVLRKLIGAQRTYRVTNFWKHDWSDLFPSHPFNMESFDKEGRPIVSVTFDKMDLRAIVLQGKTERLHKYLWNIQYEIIEHIVDNNKKYGNITQFVFLVNLDGFSPIQHTCPLCVPIHFHILDTNERYLPGFSHDVIFINAPSMYGAFIQMFRPALSGHTRRVLKVFGTNKNQWKPYLDSKIDPKQLPWVFGGTKVVDRDD